MLCCLVESYDLPLFLPLAVTKDLPSTSRNDGTLRALILHTIGSKAPHSDLAVEGNENAAPAGIAYDCVVLVGFAHDCAAPVGIDRRYVADNADDDVRYIECP